MVVVLVSFYVVQLCDEIITCCGTYFLDLPPDFGFFARAFGAAPSAASSSASAAIVSGAAIFGSGLARAATVGFAPSVRISVTRMSVNSWRWPRLRREFLRRRFLKAMTLGPRPCSITSAATEAPATVG